MSNLPLSQPFSCLGQTKGPWWIWFDDLLHNVTHTKCCQKSNTVWNLIHSSYIKLLKQYVKHLFRHIHMKYLQYILDINWTVSYLNERSIKPYFNDFFNVCVSSRLQFSRNTSVFREMIDVIVHKFTSVPKLCLSVAVQGEDWLRYWNGLCDVSHHPPECRVFQNTEMFCFVFSPTASSIQVHTVKKERNPHFKMWL